MYYFIIALIFFGGITFYGGIKYISSVQKVVRKFMVESMALYGCEFWLLKREEQRKPLEMDYLRMSDRVSRLQKISNINIKMQAEKIFFTQNSKKATKMVWASP